MDDLTREELDEVRSSAAQTMSEWGEDTYSYQLAKNTLRLVDAYEKLLEERSR